MESNQPLSPKRESYENKNFHDYVIATQPKSLKPIPVWRFAIPLLIQAALILSIPAQAVYTYITGKTVILQTVPVDPYDLLRGYSVTLSYDISRTDTLKKLPGWEELIKQYPGRNSQYSPLEEGIELYVILQEEKSSSPGIPKAWKPVRVSGKRPESLATNQVALQGTYQYNSITYGLESYYIPEDQREQINQEISQAQQTSVGQQQPIVVEVKVDSQGNAVPISMWVRERKYRF
jgi:uncharacterized membrane-anchored protein